MAKQQDRPCPDLRESSEAPNDSEENAKDTTRPLLESSTQGQPSGNCNTSAAEASEKTSTRSNLHSELESASCKVRAHVEAGDTNSSSPLAFVQVDLEATCSRFDDNGEKDTKTLRLSMGTMNLTDSVQPKTPCKSRPGASKSSPSVKCVECRESITVSNQMSCNFCMSVTCLRHRYPENHKCKKDYRTDGKEEIAKNNPKITAKKIEKL